MTSRRLGSVAGGSQTTSLSMVSDELRSLRLPDGFRSDECEARKELAAIYDNAPGILFCVSIQPDGDFRFESMSKAGLVAMGLEREHVVGCLVRDVIPAGSRDLVLNHYQEAIRSGQTVHWREVSDYPAGQKAGHVAVTPVYDNAGVATHLIGIVHDVTEHEKLQELIDGFRLKAHDHELETLLETSSQGIVSVNDDGVIVTANHALEVMFGWKPGELIGTPVELLIPSAVRKAHEGQRFHYFAAPSARLMGGGLELTGERKNGSTFPIEVSLNHVATPDGGRAFAFVTDITDKKRAEEDLRASEERLRLAQQAGMVGTFEVNLQTGKISWTPELELLYGFAPGQAPPSFEASKIAFKRLVHPEDWQHLAELFDSGLKSGHPVRGEWRVMWPDGSIHWLAGRWQVLKDETGEAARVVGVNMDVTARKATEERLREYERAIEGVEEMIVVVNREYEYLIANRQFLKMRNMTRDQVLGKHARDVLNEGVFDAIVREKLDACFEGKVVRYEIRYSYPALGERDMSVSYFPVEGPDGVDRAVCIFQDVTERKQAERARATFSRRLIETQEQERARVARELHDNINQRLALLAVELDAATQQPPATVDDLKRFLVEMQEGVATMSSEVHSISQQLHSSHLEHLGIEAAMKSFCREFSRRQAVKVDFVHGGIPAHLSQELSLCLYRVMQEALQNAATHSHAKEFEVKLSCAAGHVELIIADHGTGFESEANVSKDRLGLVSMRERVRLVNGTITIESGPSCGTRVHVRAPLTTGSTPRQQPSPLATESPMEHESR